MPARIENNQIYKTEGDFLEWLSSQNRAKSIMLGYSSVLRRYANFLALKFDLGLYGVQPGAQDMFVNTYIENLKESKLSPQTINFHLFALKAFYRSIGYGGHEVKQVYTPPRKVKILPPADQCRFLWLANRAVDARDRLVLFLAYYGGLTAAEITALNLEDVSILSKVAKISVKGSRLKNRIISVDGCLRSAVKDYLDELKSCGRLQNNGPLFEKHGKRVGSRTIQDIATDLGKVLRLPISLRLLRNTWLANQSKGRRTIEQLAKRSGLGRRQSIQLYRRPKVIEAIGNNNPEAL